LNVRSIQLSKILVPTDFSSASERGLQEALPIAREFGALIDLVHVVPVTLPAELSHIGIVLEQKRMVTEAKKRLDQFAKEQIPPIFSVETHLLEGAVAFSIVRLAERLRSDLIVTATHGYTGFKHAWIGSVAERVVRHAPCPVLTVHAAEVPTQAFCFKKVLVPIDFSEHSRKALTYAMALAAYAGGSISLLHVVEPPAYPEFGYAHVPAKESRLKLDAGKRLNDLCKSVSEARIACDSTIRTGPAHDEIKAQAAAVGASLIAVGSHGRGGLARAFFGSTVERVVRYATTPVLVVREHEHDFVAEEASGAEPR